MSPEAAAEHRVGLLHGVAAYLLWGVFPLYWPLLKPSSAGEILAHRIAWSLIVLAVLVGMQRRWSSLRELARSGRPALLLGLAAVVLSANWLTYIWGVNHGHVVETSLGYFINPLVSVLLGVVVLGERLRRLQWWALGVASIAVAVLTVDYGRPPWIALVLAFSFGFYGLLKKKAAAGPVESLTLETTVMFVPALAWLAWLAADGAMTFGGAGAGHALLLISTGLITAVPLLFFGSAAQRIPLSTLGLLQYLAPMLQFAIGVLVFGEPMPLPRLAGFGLVWLALALFTLDLLRSSHQARAIRARAAQPVRATT